SAISSRRCWTSVIWAWAASKESARRSRASAKKSRTWAGRSVGCWAARRRKTSPSRTIPKTRVDPSHLPRLRLKLALVRQSLDQLGGTGMAGFLGPSCVSQRGGAVARTVEPYRGLEGQLGILGLRVGRGAVEAGGL